VALRKCSGVVRSTKILWADVKAGTWKLFCFPNRMFLLGNKIFLVEEKRTCFQLKIGLSTEAASLSCCLASFVSSFASNDMLKRVESETTLKKTVKLLKQRFWEVGSKKRSWVFRPAQSLIWVFAKTELTC